MEALALVELSAHPAAQLQVGQVAPDVDRADQAAVLVQRPGEALLAAAGVQLGDEQAGRGVTELHRPGEAEQVVPMVDDEAGLDGLGEQRPGARPAGGVVAGRAEPVQLEPGQVADVRRELQAEEVEEAEGGQRLAVGVGGVLGDGQLGGVAQDLVEHVHRLPGGGGDDQGGRRWRGGRRRGCTSRCLRRRSSATAPGPSGSYPVAGSAARRRTTACRRPRPGPTGGGGGRSRGGRWPPAGSLPAGTTGRSRPGRPRRCRRRRPCRPGRGCRPGRPSRRRGCAAGRRNGGWRRRRGPARR